MQKKIIKKLGGATALSRLTGLSKRTVEAYTRAKNPHKMTGIPKFLFCVLLVLQNKGLLLEIINDVKRLREDL